MTLIEQIFDEHARLVSLMEQIWLLCGPDLQKASRMVVRHALVIREFAISGTDPDVAEYLSPPQQRFRDAVVAFYRAARRQLRVADPEDLVQRDPPRGGY